MSEEDLRKRRSVAIGGGRARRRSLKHQAARRTVHKRIARTEEEADRQRVATAIRLYRGSDDLEAEASPSARKLRASTWSRLARSGPTTLPRSFGRCRGGGRARRSHRATVVL